MAFALFALSLGLGVDGRAAVLDAIPWVLDSTTGSSSYAQTGDVIVTNDGTEEDGAMWDPCTINMTQSFNMTFTINFGGNVYGCGADGMAFVMQTQGTGVVGAASAEHGYDSGGINGASLAVIMDTWTNTGAPYDDPPGEQTLGIDDNDSVSDVACNGTGPVTITGPCRPSIIADGSQATDANDHQVNFTWVPSGSNGTMTVTVDGIQRAVWTVDNYATIFNADGGDVDDVTFGITGGTGGGYNVQQAGLDNGSSADNGTEVSDLCGDATFTPNAIATETITPGNVCSVTQPPTFTVSETPTISATFTVSPTPSPTFTPLPTDCGTPTYVGGQALLQGQPGDSGGSTTTNFTYNVPSVVPDALVMVVVQNNTGGQLVDSMSFGGSAMTAGPSVTNVAGGKEALYYLPVGSLAAGSKTLAVTYNNTDNDPQIITIYV
ncbi:MAG TPA: hypothetical protein VK786_07545, partial [bacterium]|nr:hypothetical protein [bacterium]